MQTRQRVAHFAFDFGLRHECRDRVDHDHVDRARAHQRISNFKRLFARVRLGNQQIRHVHAKLARVLDVQRVFCVDKRCRAAELLHFGDDLQRQRGFTRRFRPVNFDYTTTRQTADAQCDVESQRSRGDHLDIFDCLTRAEPHDRPFAELFFNLRERGSERLALFSSQSSRAFLAFFHESSFAMMNGV